MVRDGDDDTRALRRELGRLKRRVGILQAVLAGVVAAGCLAAWPGVGVLRARGLVIVDAQGRERILLGAPTPSSAGRDVRPTEALVFRNAEGADRVVVGEEPGPRVAGRDYARVAPGWGMAIFNPTGDERGGFNYLDGRGAAIAIDRPTGDAMGMLVDEKHDLAAFVLNYDNGGKLHTYPTAVEIGSKGDRAFVETRNRDGTPAGSLLVSGSGKARTTSASNLDEN